MYYLLIIFLLSSLSANLLKGRVINEAGDPIEGANIELLESSGGTYTDKNGFFIIDNPPF